MSRQNSYSYEELLASGRGELFGPDSPRLPSPPMLMIDRITSITEDGGTYGKGQIIAELDIRPDLWFFGCHFKGDPVMPGCLGLDAMWQLIGFFQSWMGYTGKGRALAGDIKLTGQVESDAKLVTYTINIKRLISRKLVMGIADGTMTVDGKDIYQAKDLRVGVFKPGQM